MTSKCGKNKKVVIAECVTDVLVIYYWTDTQQHGIYLFYIIKKQPTTEKAFLFQNLSTWLKSQPLPTLSTMTNTKKAIWRNLSSVQMKQSPWLLCIAKEFWLVQENYTTVKLDLGVPELTFNSLKTCPFVLFISPIDMTARLLYSWMLIFYV